MEMLSGDAPFGDALSGSSAAAPAWRRAAAFIADYLVLYVVTAVLANVGESVWRSFGPDGWAVGFMLTLAYFTVLHSHIANGQSMGYRVLGLAVRTSDGDHLSLPLAAGRFVLFSPLLFMSDINRLITLYGGLELGWAAAPIVLVVSVALLPGMVMVDPLRRGLHDLLMGTVVVAVDSPDVPPERPWTRSLIIAGTFALVFMGIMAYLRGSFDNPEQDLAIRRLYGRLSKDSLVREVVVMERAVGPDTLDAEPRFILLVGGYLPHRVYQDSVRRGHVINQLINTVKNTDLQGLSSDSLSAGVRTGFTLGYYAKWEATEETVPLFAGESPTTHE